MNQQTEKKIPRWPRRILLTTGCILLLLITSFLILITTRSEAPAPEETVQAATPPSTPAPTPAPTPTPEPVWEPPAHFLELHEENEDFVGWLSIGGTVIDFPVVQSSEEVPEFYLNRNFDKESDTKGIPFLDARSHLEPESDLFIIYGHNLRNGTMFSPLLSYETWDFMDEHPYIRFDTMVGPGLYEVAAVFWYDASSPPTAFKPHYVFDWEDEESFAEYAAGINDCAFYETGVELEYGDQLLMLMTCDRRVIPDGRLIVLAKRVAEPSPLVANPDLYQSYRG